MQTGSVSLHPSAPAGAGRELCGNNYYNAEPLNVQKSIGSTVYEIEVYVKKDTGETIEDKIMRLIRND